MYKRDVGILLLSAFAIYFAIQHEGPFAFRKAWFHHLDEAEDDSAELPPPIVADLNGDGQAEVIVATHDCRIQVLVPRPAGRSGNGFAAANVLAEVNLLPAAWPPALMKAKRAVAMRSGYLDMKPLEAVRAPRKQVLVVVLSDWTAICMDHNLQVMWTTTVREELGGPYGWSAIHAHVREVAIHISNHTMRLEDRGIVIVGGSVDLGDLRDEDELDAELETEKASDAAKHLPKSAASDTWSVGGVDVSKHFSYYAMAGGTGETRWKHEGQDFHRDVGNLAEQVTAQHNYRLDAKTAAGRHYGEAACRDFRESILTTLPHRWTGRADTQLRLAHFRRHKEGAGERKSQLAAKTHHRPRQGDLLKLRTPPNAGLDHKNPVAKLMSKAADKAGTGGSSTSMSASEQHSLPPNVIVAHLEEGIEAIHLYTGRTICKLYLPPGGLHTDLNADGIPDHIQVVAENRLGEDHSDTSHRHAHSCWVSATSGVPPSMPFFNGSICTHGHGLGVLLGGESLHDASPAPLEIAPPAVLPRPGAFGLYTRGAGQVHFLNNRGEMTGLDSYGKELWRHAHGVTWANWEGAESKHRIVPTLKAISMRWGGLPTVILAGGAFQAVIVSEHGHVLDRFSLPGPPRLPLQVVDFNSDGLTDVILATHDGIFGYAQVRRPGGVPFSALLGLLIVAMVFVYITHQSGPKVAQKGRSTDRID